MTPERAMRIIDAYGARPARWPEEDREALLGLLAAEPGLAAYAHEAGALDSRLDAAGRDMPPAWLAGRIMASAPAGGRPAWWQPVLRFGGAWQPAGALAMSLAAGLWLGAAGLASESLTSGVAGTGPVQAEDDVAYALYGFAGTAAEEWGYDG